MVKLKATIAAIHTYTAPLFEQNVFSFELHVFHFDKNKLFCDLICSKDGKEEEEEREMP